MADAPAAPVTGEDLARHEGLCRRLVLLFREKLRPPVAMDEDDLLQEARIGLKAALETHDPEITPLEHYASTVIWRRLLNKAPDPIVPDLLRLDGEHLPDKQQEREEERERAKDLTEAALARLAPWRARYLRLRYGLTGEAPMSIRRAVLHARVNAGGDPEAFDTRVHRAFRAALLEAEGE